MSKTNAVYTVYTPRLRRLMRWMATALVAAAGAGPSAAGVAVIRVFDLPVHYHLYVLVVAGIATVAAATAVLPRAPLMGNERLRRKLAAKILAEPEGREFLEGAVFVGMAPTAELLQWHGDTDWDVGYVKVIGDTLAFWGDRCRWTLPRQAVVGRQELDRPDVPRIILRWSAGHIGGVVALSSRHGSTVAQARATADALAEAVRAWLAESDGTHGPSWGWPPTESEAGDGRPLVAGGWAGCVGVAAALTIAATTCLLVAMPPYTAGMKHLAIMQAVAVGWPILLVISELAVAGS